MKAVLTRASDLNAGLPNRAYLELENMEDLRTLLMRCEEPVMIMFAQEIDAPAEIEIMVYDDFIEEVEE